MQEIAIGNRDIVLRYFKLLSSFLSFFFAVSIGVTDGNLMDHLVFTTTYSSNIHKYSPLDLKPPRRHVLEQCGVFVRLLNRCDYERPSDYW